MLKQFLRREEKDDANDYYLALRDFFRNSLMLNPDNYDSVIVFFDWILRRGKFLFLLKCFSNDVGYGDDVSGCYLPSEFENEEEEGYIDSGVMFYLNEVDEWIDDKMFLQCIEFVSEIYCKNCESKEEIEELSSSLKKIKEKHKEK